MVSIESKQCSKCKVVKPYSEFYKSKDTKLGLSSKCKKCYKVALSINWLKNEKSKYLKDRKNNPEKYKARAKKYYESTKDGKYHVYLLPEEHYCGQTDSPTYRKLSHKSNGRYVEDMEVVMSFDTRKEALTYESMFHSLGWYGENNNL